MCFKEAQSFVFKLIIYTCVCFQAQNHQVGLQEEEADAGGGGGQRGRRLRAGAHLRLPAAQRESVQTPLEVRGRAPHIFPTTRTHQGKLITF